MLNHKTEMTRMEAAKDAIFTCYCMECPTCLEEDDYNEVHYHGCRFVAVYDRGFTPVIVKNHHTCTWCKMSTDFRDIHSLAGKIQPDARRENYQCLVCNNPNSLRIYRVSGALIRETYDMYRIL